MRCSDLTFSLSGVQNKIQQFAQNHDPSQVARYCLGSVIYAVYSASVEAMKRYPGLEIVFSGGVASNSMLRGAVKEMHPVFAKPEFSTDNAMGVAVLSYRQLEG